MDNTDIARLLDEMIVLGAKLASLPSPYPLEAAVFGKPASEADISALEEETASSLPNDYKAFLIVCGSVSAMDMHSGYAVLDPQVAQGIMAEQPEVPQSVLRAGGRVPVAPVGANGCGDLFLLAAHAPFTVWKWKHEIGMATDGVLPEESDALVPISSSFTEFIRRVVEDWRHFLDGDREWPYLSG